MFGARLKLIRLLGIPIFVDASWLIILALLTLSFAEGMPLILHDLMPQVAQELAPQQYWIMGLVTALSFFVCILLHELGHAVVARARGMTIRGITLFLFGGVADIGDEPESATTEFLMAIAGPLVTLVLVIVCWVLAAIGYQGGWPYPVVIVLGYLALINGIVLVFNLVPAFPLDGGRVFRSILWGATGNLRRATFWAAQVGEIFAWILIAWGIFQFFRGNWLGGIWMGLIGLFLKGAAQSSYQQVLLRQALQGEPVRRFMNPEPIAVPPSLDLRHWVEDFVYTHHRKAFPVVSDGHLEGYVDTRALTQIPRSEWGGHTVGEIMRHDLAGITVSPSTDAMEALRKMQRSGVTRLLVTEGDRLMGILTLRDLLRFLNLKLELEGADGNGRAGSPGRAGSVSDRSAAENGTSPWNGAEDD
jgi:Zn-dependent protease/CBS domain-containing protein